MSEKSSNPPRGNCDPGWNDPPKLQYNPGQSGKSKLNLNKRIAFPLHGSSTTTTSKPTAIVSPSPFSLPLSTAPTAPSQPPVAIVPPMPHCTAPPPTQRVPPLSINESTSRIEESSSESSETIIEEETIPENALEYCIRTFQSFVSRIQDSNNIRSDEIQRRINLMKQMWLSGTLTSSVHRKLFNIAKALETNNFNEAIENHRALVVDHSNMCIAWAAALRQIILTIQGNNSNNQSAAQTPIMGMGASNILVPNAIPSDILAASAESQSESSVGNDIQNI